MHKIPMGKLEKYPTLPDMAAFSKEACLKELKGFQKKLFDLQNVFFADGRFALLVVFQGLDTSGKDGTIRHVMSCMNPAGVDVKYFKAPMPEEISHDFLWRVWPHFPAKGIIEVFNRSYYEDIIVPSIAKKMSKDDIDQRMNLVNTVEEHLEANGTHILKFFLHISREEQEVRLKERLIKPHKMWKYAKADELVPKKWDEYIEVYDKIITKCNNPNWHIIPAGKRWYRNYLVAKIVTEYLGSLHLKYPTKVASED
ncbi:PPK2 family polyphosphate kinase [Parasediminibacterium sp. JCM 36343]|uniref:PPK2 family polyphosphate kinase n=1 Tax=Parasediminibacterium sp. JCM 36343 TaxID=3374279 RepID=UPI00397A6F85